MLSISTILWNISLEFFQKRKFETLDSLSNSFLHPHPQLLVITILLFASMNLSILDTLYMLINQYLSLGASLVAQW